MDFDIDREAEEWGWEMERPYFEQMTFEQLDQIERLLSRANLPYEVIELYTRKTKDRLLTEQEAYVLIDLLKDNQVDPIQGGFNYTATDMVNKINENK